MITTKQYYDFGNGHCYDCFIQAYGLSTKWILDLWSTLLLSIFLRENYSQISWTPINLIACNHGENDKELYCDEGAVLHFQIGLLCGHWYFVVNCVVHWFVVTYGPLSGLLWGWIVTAIYTDPLSHRGSTINMGSSVHQVTSSLPETSLWSIMMIFK